MADSRIPHSQLRLELSPFYAAANRRVFGFVTDLLRIDSMNTSSPVMVTAVVKLPFVYWSTIEQPKSWVYVRVIAFSSQAATTEPIALTVGDAISGIVVNTSSKYKTAQLIGWKVVYPRLRKPSQPPPPPANSSSWRARSTLTSV